MIVEIVEIQSQDYFDEFHFEVCVLRYLDESAVAANGVWWHWGASLSVSTKRRFADKSIVVVLQTI